MQDVLDDVSAALADAPALLTTQEVAKLLRVDVRTVSRWRASGRLGSVKTHAGKPGRVLVPRASVLAMLRGEA